jgi:hypothetical protein
LFDLCMAVGSCVALGWTRPHKVVEALRIFRVVKRAEPLRRSAFSLLVSTLSVWCPLAFLVLAWLAYALLGLSLFSRPTPTGAEHMADDLTCSASFADYPSALYTLFLVLTDKHWSELARACDQQRSFASAFFVTFVLVALCLVFEIIRCALLPFIERVIEPPFRPTSRDSEASRGLLTGSGSDCLIINEAPSAANSAAPMRLNASCPIEERGSPISSRAESRTDERAEGKSRQSRDNEFYGRQQLASMEHRLGVMEMILSDVQQSVRRLFESSLASGGHHNELPSGTSRTQCQAQLQAKSVSPNPAPAPAVPVPIKLVPVERRAASAPPDERRAHYMPPGPADNLRLGNGGDGTVHHFLHASRSLASPLASHVQQSSGSKGRHGSPHPYVGVTLEDEPLSVRAYRAAATLIANAPPPPMPVLPTVPVPPAPPRGSPRPRPRSPHPDVQRRGASYFQRPAVPAAPDVPAPPDGQASRPWTHDRSSSPQHARSPPFFR